jgi:hypothetical protein
MNDCQMMGVVCFCGDKKNKNLKSLLNLSSTILSSCVCVCVCVWQYHPDVNKQPGAEQKFKEISTAYEVCLSSSSPATNPLS